MNLPPDGFRLIPGFPRYAISQDGHVLSVCRRNGKGTNLPWSKARPLTPSMQKDGYYAFNLRNKQGSARKMRVHVLVLTTFVGPRPDGMECRHLDGSRTNNHVSNLAWGTTKQNRHDAICHDRSNEGEKQGSAKLTNDRVREIRTRYANGELQQVLAEAFRVAPSTISVVVNRRTWKHIQ